MLNNGCCKQLQECIAITTRLCNETYVVHMWVYNLYGCPWVNCTYAVLFFPNWSNMKVGMVCGAGRSSSLVQIHFTGAYIIYKHFILIRKFIHIPAQEKYCLGRHYCLALFCHLKMAKSINTVYVFVYHLCLRYIWTICIALETSEVKI